MDDRVAAEGARALADDGGAGLGAGRATRRSTSRRSATTRRRNPTPTGPRAWTRSIRSCCAPTRSSASRSREQELLAGVAVDSVFDSVSVATTFKKKLGELGIIFCSISEAVARPSGAGPEIPRLGRAAERQLLRGAQLGGVQRRLVRLRAQRRALPDGAVDLLPHQRRRDRPVRAHADHRRRGQLRQLPRRLHGAAARREPAPCGGGRADRARRRADQILDRAELVPGRQGGQGRHLQLRHQARRLPRPQLQDLLDPGRDRLGDHLEVPELHPAGRQLGRRVLLGRA